jgi:TRAP-type C4-dicarboxylate transport system permease small subunit
VTLLQAARAGFERLLEAIVIALVAALTLIIVAGFVFRYAGRSLVWYDELASIGLVWLTYYGSALAALRGAHIGVAGVVNAMPPRARLVATLFAEACVFLFFVILAVTGAQVLAILGDDRMVSLSWVPLRLTQSVIPVGAVLFIIAETLRLPTVLHDARTRGFLDVEIKEALELADQVPVDDTAKTGEAR